MSFSSIETKIFYSYIINANLLLFGWKLVIFEMK